MTESEELRTVGLEMGGGESLTFGILGPLAAWRGSTQLVLGGAKPRALLALLLLQANRVVSSDRLVDDLWGEHPIASAQATLQVYVMQLRRLLEPDHRKGGPYEVVVTAEPGYLIRVAPGALDLHRFERLATDAVATLSEQPEQAALQLGEALGLWRGPALADLAFEEFTQAPAARLEELRLAALEKRIEADLACGRETDLVGELQELVAAHPLREVFGAHLMLALYRSGRQADALDAYQRIRRALVDELGIDPGPLLQRLEHDILVQDPSLELESSAKALPSGSTAPARSVLAVTDGSPRGTAVLELAAQLGAGPVPHEVILTQLLSPTEAGRLADVSAELGNRRDHLFAEGTASRVAVFTSSDAVEDLSRLARRAATDLMMLPATDEVVHAGTIDPVLTELLRESLCDVAFLVVREPSRPWLEGPVLVPFGAGANDWAALELGAWIARSASRPLHVLGTVAETEVGSRDASRLLADAGLLIQRASGVVPVPRLVEGGRDGPVNAAADGGLLVIGLSERWSDEGLGMTRWAIAVTASVPVLFVRKGLRPGGLAPDASVTRFGWSVTIAI